VGKLALRLPETAFGFLLLAFFYPSEKGYGTLEGIGKNGSGSWYDDASYTKSGVNLNGGFILGFTNFGINLGFNSLSKTMYIGIGMKTGKK